MKIEAFASWKARFLADLRPGAIHYALDEMFALKLIETLGREEGGIGYTQKAAGASA
jgi:hypothetical protein